MNQPINANQTYKLRTWIDSSGLQEQTKYWFAFKPSAETIQQAINNGHLYALDPWVDPAGDNLGLIAFYNFNQVNETTNNRTNSETRFHLRNPTGSDGTNGSWTNLGKFQGAWNTSDSPAYYWGIGNDTLGNNWTSFANTTVTMWVMANDSTNDNTAAKNFFFFGDNEVYLTLIRRNGTASNNLGYCLQSTFTGQIGDPINCTGVVENASQWRHLAFVYTNASQNLTFFVDGLLVGNMRQAGRQTDTDHATERDTFRIFGTGGIQSGSSFIIDQITVWNITMNISDIQSIAGNANETRTGINITANLISPPNATQTGFSIFNFSAESNSSGTYNLSNVTFQMWYSNGTLFNETFKIISGKNNITNFSIFNIKIANYLWNVLACGNSSATSDCRIDILNFSFTRNLIAENSQNFTSTVIELSQQTYVINMTYDTSEFSGITAKLVYNGSKTTATTSDTGNNKLFSVTRSIPNVNSQQSISFYWEFQLTTSTAASSFGNSTTRTQTVNIISLDNCGSNTVLFLNYSIRDEEFQTLLDGATFNTTVEVDLILLSPIDASINTTFTTKYSELSNPQVCFNSNLTNEKYLLFVQTRYVENSSYVIEYHHIQNFSVTNSSIPQHINLLDLKTVDSQEFLITLKDSVFAPLENALIDITRKYVSEGVFKSVEVPKTDDNGQTVAHLVLGDVIYTFIAKKNGQIIATFENIVALCEDQTTGNCKINLNAFQTGSPLEEFSTVDNLIFSMSFNEGTRDVSASFTTTDGSSALVSLNTTLFNNATATNICSVQLLSSSGTISCNVLSNFGNVSILAELFNSDQFVSSRIFTIKSQSSSDAFGATGIMLLLILYITVPMMFITEKIGVVIGAILGLVMAGLLNLYEGGGLLGLGATIIWFIVAGGIIIWKINKIQ